MSILARRLFPRAGRGEPDLDLLLLLPPYRARARPGSFWSGLFEPLLVDGFALLRGPFDRVLGGHLPGRRLSHHVADDEVIVDLVDRRPRRTRISGRG